MITPSISADLQTVPCARVGDYRKGEFCADSHRRTFRSRILLPRGGGIWWVAKVVLRRFVARNVPPLASVASEDGNHSLTRSVLIAYRLKGQMRNSRSTVARQ